MNHNTAILDLPAPSLSPERAARSFYAERIPLAPPLPDRDLKWRWGVAILAALLLHLGVVTTIEEGFLHKKPSPPAPIPVEVVTELPKPPERKPVEKPPEQPKPPEPQQPLPYRSSNGNVADKPSGSVPQAPQSSEKPQPPAPTPPIAAPEAQTSTPKPLPVPAMPSEPSPQTVAVPAPTPPLDTQQAMVAPPIPPKKPPALPAQKTVSTTPSQSQDAASTTEQDSHTGQAGYDKYLKAMKAQILRHYFYPPTAEMFHLTGTAVYDITLDRSGQVQHVKLTQSAGEVLDKAGFNAIIQSSPFGPLPTDFNADGVVVTLVFPMPVPNQ